MNAVLVGLSLVLMPGADKSEPQSQRIGYIFVVDNLRTKQLAILQELTALYPGGKVPGEADMLRSEIRLLMKYHKRFDLDNGKRPTIQVKARKDDSVFCDIVVSFPEKERKQP
jgi:hypothetical protein